jgi:Mn2+/Fe2+ NRAMP family transporter
MGPGLIVMGGGNDAGGVQVYAQMGQDYGMRLLWTLILLFPILSSARKWSYGSARFPGSGTAG